MRVGLFALMVLLAGSSVALGEEYVLKAKQAVQLLHSASSATGVPISIKTGDVTTFAVDVEAAAAKLGAFLHSHPDVTSVSVVPQASSRRVFNISGVLVGLRPDSPTAVAVGAGSTFANPGLDDFGHHIGTATGIPVLLDRFEAAIMVMPDVTAAATKIIDAIPVHAIEYLHRNYIVRP